jgi:ABC-type transport system involved in cytochrome c biogenesis permease subunit
MSTWSRYLPYLVAGGAVLYLAAAAFPPIEGDKQMRVEAFGRLPVQEGGRLKPLDTVARNSLVLISDRSEVYRADGSAESPSRWALDLMTGKAQDDKVVRIENDELLTLLGLQERPGSFRYAWNEFREKIPDLAQKAEEAQLRRKKGLPLDKVDDKLLTLAQHLEMYFNLASLSEPWMVPPEHGDKWLSVRDAVEIEQSTGQANRRAEALVAVLSAYAKDDTAGFNQALAEYRRSLERDMPVTLAHADFEYVFNHFSPFYQCAILYVLAFVLVCFSWVGFTEPLNRSAFWLLVVTFVVHTGALIGRMYLMERWLVFVTNLYSSALFIGWGCCVLGLILERIFRNGIGNLVAAVAGFVTMVIAHNLASGDTLEMMRAVLDTNFWLATHVTCVTSGYTATFVAGLLGMVFIVRGVLTPSLDRPTFVHLTQALYGVVCFATLLSFVGTVLGGIWGDQSWGRFWGWDPKENGALLIVLWNALILHARWGGLVKQRGMAVLAVAGNIVTLWSWFGVNMLGVGLHSYGFMAFNAVLLATFIPLHLAVIGLGLVPTAKWRSFGTAQPGPKTDALPATPGARLRPEASAHVVAAR